MTPTKPGFSFLQRTSKPILLAAAGLLLGTSAAMAQFRASLTGTVTDPTGAVVPGANVTLTDVGTGRVLTSVSNSAGVYNFNALPPDTFKLSVAMAGFQSKTITGLHIIPEQPNNVDVPLALSGTSTEVNVDADTIPTLDTATASLSNTVNSNEVQHLPSAGRDVFQLAQLAPGAFSDGQRSGNGSSNSLPGTQGPGSSNTTDRIGWTNTEAGPQVLANGGQYETNSYTIDGISTVSAVWGGTSVITPNEDSVDSVKITSNGYDAEFGRFSGSNLQITTKSGTNQIHGSAFFRASRPGLNAFQRYNGPSSLVNNPVPTGVANNNVNRALYRGLLRDTQDDNDYGGSIGGPIIKNRLFAFFAFERLDNGTNVPGTAWYETPQLDALAPAGFISNTYTNFPQHGLVGATMISSTCGGIGLVEGVNCRTVSGGIDIGSPLKTGKGTQDGSYVSSSNPGLGNGFDGIPDLAQYSTLTPSKYTFNQYNGRLDADVTKKDHLAFAIYWVPGSHTFINGPSRGYNTWNHQQVNDAFSVIYNHTFSSTFLNEARINAAGWRWNELADNPQVPFGLPTDSINNYGNAGVQSFGPNGPSHLDQWTYGVKDVATKVYRTHTIKFGGEVTKLQYLQDPINSTRPSYNFYSIWNFLNDAPYNESGQFNRFTGVPAGSRFDQREYIYGGFIQDDWKITKNLTVNAGLRYSYFDALYSKQGNMPRIVFGQGAATFTGITNVLGGKQWQPDSANFGPQFGFAFNPDLLNRRLVVRGGYGINYNQEEIAISANTSYNPNNVVNASFGNSTTAPNGADPRIQYSISTTPYAITGYPTNTNAITAYNANGLPTTTGFSVTALPNRLRTQQVHHYSLQTEMDLGYNMVASVGYEGSSAKHLIFHQDLYLYGEYHGLAPNPSINYLEYYGDTGGSNYNALLVDVKHNMAHNFMIDASFTWAKSMDDNSGPYEQDFYTYNPIYNRGSSDFDIRDGFKLYGLYTPKLYYGSNAFGRVLLNGFNISGIWNAHTGFPWTPTVNYGTSAYYTAARTGTLRPTSYNKQGGHNYGNSAFEGLPGVPSLNFSGGGAAYFGQYTQAQLQSTTFPNPIVFYPVPGIGRNTFFGPRYSAVDATITKSFGLPNHYLGERTGLEFRVDAFNLFNQNNAAPTIDTNINDSTFGLSTAGLAGRQVQMQARLSF